MPNKIHTTTWVVVADNYQAKIYKSTTFPKLIEVALLGHPEARLQAQDLTSSEPGRTFQRGGVTRHAYQAKTDPKRVEMGKFATDVAEFLNRSLKDEKFDRLFIIAEATFLGALRPHLSAQVRKVIVGEQAKELTSCDLKTIEQHYSEM